MEEQYQIICPSDWILPRVLTILANHDTGCLTGPGYNSDLMFWFEGVPRPDIDPYSQSWIIHVAERL